MDTDEFLKFLNFDEVITLVGVFVCVSTAMKGKCCTCFCGENLINAMFDKLLKIICIPWLCAIVTFVSVRYPSRFIVSAECHAWDSANGNTRVLCLYTGPVMPQC